MFLWPVWFAESSNVFFVPTRAHLLCRKKEEEGGQERWCYLYRSPYPVAVACAPDSLVLRFVFAGVVSLIPRLLSVEKKIPEKKLKLVHLFNHFSAF